MMNNLSEQTVCIHITDKTVKRLVRWLPLIPRKERTEIMHGFIIFILGCFLGDFVGVALMCMLQINRINRYEMKDKKDDEDEEKL